MHFTSLGLPATTFLIPLAKAQRAQSFLLLKPWTPDALFPQWSIFAVPDLHCLIPLAEAQGTQGFIIVFNGFLSFIPTLRALRLGGNCVHLSACSLDGA